MKRKQREEKLERVRRHQEVTRKPGRPSVLYEEVDRFGTVVASAPPKPPRRRSRSNSWLRRVGRKVGQRDSQ